MQHDPQAPTLERVIGLLRRRFPLIVLCMVVVAAAAFAVSKGQPKKYTATASLVFGSDSLSQQIAGLQGGSQITNSSALLAQQANHLEFVKGGGTAARTASAIGHGMTPARVLGSLNIAGQGETGVIGITATSGSPVLAAKLANTYAEQFVLEQKAASRDYYRSALALVHKQLTALSPQQRFGVDGLQLQNRAQTLRMLSELSTGGAQAAQTAFPPSGPSSPRTSRNTGLGLFVGLLVGVALALLFERLDGRIRDARELEDIYGLPLLGAVPKSSALTRGGGRSPLPPAQAEVFKLIRAHMRLAKANRDARTVAIASAAHGEGRTVVARRLAEVAAAVGSRTLLLEADLHEPALARILELQASPGLADVLDGGATIDQAVQRVVLEGPQAEGEKAPTLDVLVAGTASEANAAALLESAGMAALLEQVRAGYDLVVIDTAPVTIVSDAIPLLSRVDGIVVVGFVGRTRRHEAQRLQQVLQDSDAVLLGVVANGSSLSRVASPTQSSRGGSALASSGGSTSASAADRQPVVAGDI